MPGERIKTPDQVKVLVACEVSLVVRNAFLAAGYDAYSCDLQTPESGLDNRHIKDDIRHVIEYGDWDVLAVMHPPCTRLCLSGIQWLTRPPKGKTIEEMWNDLVRDAELFSTCWNARHIRHRAIENPVMHRHARRLIENYEKPYYVQPWWFGEPYFKKTGFTLRDLPELKPTNKLTPPKKDEEPERHKAWSAIHRAPPGKDRANFRSKTFTGIAEAIVEQWGDYVLRC